MRKIKRKLKRIMAMVLAGLMLLLAMPLGAMAADMDVAEPDPATYAVVVKESEGGTLSFVKDGQEVPAGESEEIRLDFCEGEKVTLKAKAEEGFEYAGCRAVSLILDLEKEFLPDDEITFEMPASDVEITATFEKGIEETPAETSSAEEEETTVPETETAAETRPEEQMQVPESTTVPQEEDNKTEAPAFDPEIMETLPGEDEAEQIIKLQEVKVSVKKDAAETRSVGDVFDFWSDPNWGDGDVLYYGSINGVTTPAYCIDHGNDRPSSYYTQIDPVFYANQLGYVMKHGYPNEDWGLSGPEAQYLTQAAVYGVIGVDMWNISDGIYPPSYIYDALWGNGNFSIATNLVSQAQANASSADAAYVNFWYPTGHPSSQRLVTPLPYTPEGYLNIVKSTSKKTSDIRLIKTSDYSDLYSLKGAEYGIYSDASCTQLVGTMKTNAEGVAEYKGLDLKKYYVKEITPPEGYQVSDEVIIYDLSVYESRYALDAVYTVTGGGKTYILTCGASTGKSNTLTLNEGTYTITEKTAAKGTIKNTGSQTVTVYPEQTTTVRTGIAVNAPEVYTMEKTVKEEIIRGGTGVEKTDEDTKDTEHGDASVEGIRFAVVNRTGHAVKAEDTVYDNGVVVKILTLDEAGKAETGDEELTYGTYQIYELRSDATIAAGDAYNGSTKLGSSILANEAGYLYKAQNLTVKVDVHKEIKTVSFTDDIIRGGVEIEKWDKELDRKDSQGDADFSGIQFEIKNTSKAKVVVDGKTFEPDETVYTMTTDAEGSAVTPDDLLPYGTYTIQEVATNDSYLLTDGAVYTFEIRENGEIVKADTEGNDLVFKDNPVRGGVSVQKVSKETGLANPQGAATLEGAKITIYNDSLKAVLVNGQEYEPGQAVLTLTTDENGFAQTGERDLPYGSYYAVEEESPEGYLLNEDWKAEFQIREDGVIVDMTTEPVEDQIGRRGFEFKKTVNGEERIANCLFEVTMTATGETHYIVTDPNGVYNSRKFSANNGNDAAVKKNTDGSYTIDESKLSYKNNVWFSMDSEGNTVEPIEGYDAFVYGEYIFKEIRTSANANLNMISFHGHVYEDGFYLENDGDIYDLGTKDDKEITIGTTATDAADGDKNVTTMGEVRIIDRVEYNYLETGKEYTLEGKLFNKMTGAFVTDENGNTVTARTAFIAEGASGTVDVEFVFDGNLLIEAKQIVVFESLYEDEMLLVVHNDPKDVDQTLDIEEPEIATTLTDKQTGNHKVTASEDITLVDTITYKNLVKGETYTTEGILMDKETGEPVLDDSGNEIKASAQFTAKGKEGTVDVEFRFSGVKLAGKNVVAFETVKYEDREVAVHADIDDADQTVEIEKPEEPEIPEKPDAPKTGDETNMLLWVLIMLGAAITAAGGIIYCIRKRKTDRQ